MRSRLIVDGYAEKLFIQCYMLPTDRDSAIFGRAENICTSRSNYTSGWMMADLKNITKDMFKQRVVQGFTASIALVSLALWFLGQWWGSYVAAAAIILFAVATLHWIDDEEAIEKDRLCQTEKR
jgi:hypothetical protein